MMFYFSYLSPTAQVLGSPSTYRVQTPRGKTGLVYEAQNRIYKSI